MMSLFFFISSSFSTDNRLNIDGTAHTPISENARLLIATRDGVFFLYLIKFQCKNFKSWTKDGLVKTLTCKTIIKSVQLTRIKRSHGTDKNPWALRRQIRLPYVNWAVFQRETRELPLLSFYFTGLLYRQGVVMGGKFNKETSARANNVVHMDLICFFTLLSLVQRSKNPNKRYLT